MFACFVGFGVVGTQEAHCGEACGRGGWTESQGGGQEGKTLGKSILKPNVMTSICLVCNCYLHVSYVSGCFWVFKNANLGGRKGLSASRGMWSLRIIWIHLRSFLLGYVKRLNLTIQRFNPWEFRWCKFSPLCFLVLSFFFLSFFICEAGLKCWELNRSGSYKKKKKEEERNGRATKNWKG